MTHNTREGVEEILAKKLHALETDWSDGCYIRGEDVDVICDYIHQELQKAREEERERMREAYEAGRMFAYNEALEACSLNEFASQIEDDLQNKIRRPDIYETSPSPLKYLLDQSELDQPK